MERGSSGEAPEALSPRSLETTMRHLTPCVCYDEHNGAFEFLFKKLRNHLPLQNVTWEGGQGRRQTAAAPGVSLDFLPAAEEQQTSLPVQWYRRPFLHLFVLEAEMSEYKKVLRAHLRKWTQERRERQQEWLIVYTAPQSSGGYSLSLGRGVDGKLRSDFTKERVVQVRKVESIGEDWNELLKRIRELVAAAFQRQIGLYQKEVGSLLGRSSLPGWNYCNYFVVREGLIFTFMQAKLFEECFKEYEQLERIYDSHRIEPFIASMEEHRLGSAREWASVQVREKIYLNRLAEFDFRHYVFSRKFSLLINMQRPFAAVRLAILFLQDLYDLTLRSCAAEGSSQETLAKVILFLSSWTCAFVAAIENDTRLQAALNLSTPPPPVTAAASSTDGGPPPLLAGHKCYSAMGDLIYCARSKLDYLVAVGLAGKRVLVEGVSHCSKAGALFGMLEQQKEWLLAEQREAVSMVEHFSGSPPGPTDESDGQQSSALSADLEEEGDGEEAKSELNSSTHGERKNEPEDSKEPDDEEAPKVKASLPVLLGKELSVQREFFAEVGGRIGELAGAFVSHEPLRRALESSEEFDGFYVSLTEAAAEKYKSSTYRGRSARRAHAEMGNLHFENGNYEKAASLFKSLCASYLDEAWQGLATDMRLKLAICAAEMEQQLDYLTAVLGLSSPSCSEEFIRRHFNEELLRLAPQLPAKTERDLASIVTASVALDQTKAYHVGDTVSVVCSLHSHMLDPLPVDAIRFSIIEVDRESHLRLVQSIDFEERSVTLLPGVNRLTLSAPLTSKGDFLPNRLALELGNLRLGQAFDTTETEQLITVERSESTLELELVNNSGCYFSGQRQYLKMRVATNEDPIHVGSLTVSCSSGVSIPNFGDGTIVVTGADGNVRLCPFDLANGSLQLPPSQRHEELHIRVPVVSPPGPGSHEMSLLITYQKCANIQETFDIEVRVDIDFADPLHVTQQLLYTSEELQFLQCLVLNTGLVDLCLHEFSLVPPPGYSVVEDITALLSGQVLASQKEISLAFPVKRAKSGQEDGAGELEIQFSLNAKDDALAEHYRHAPMAAFQHKMPVVFASSTTQYDVKLGHPKNVTAGQFIEFSFTISAKQVEEKSLSYALHTPGNRWVVLGKTKSSFTLRSGEAKTFNCRLMPVTVGWVKLPEVRLTSNGEALGGHKEQYIYVVPKRFFSSTCVLASTR